VRDVLGLIVFGAVLAMGVTATNGVLNLALAGVVSWSSSVSVWWVWWVGDAMGVLLVAPVILTWPPILKCDGTRRSFSN
jgi:integral membrane sensor domain MASE1